MSGWVVGSLGAAVAPTAIAFAVLAQTRSSSDLGYVVAARSIALVAALLFGGVVADRLPRRVVLAGGAWSGGVAQAATAILLLAGPVPVGALVGLQVLNGCASAFVLPAVTGALQQAVSPVALHRANVVFRMGGNAGAIGGAAVGGLLVAWAGPGWGIAIDAMCYLVAACLFAAVDLKPVSPEAFRTGILHELASGWRDFRSRTWLWSIVVQFAFVNAANGAVLQILGPLTAQLRLGGAQAWGLIMAAFSLGYLAGGLCSLRLRYVRRPLLVAVVCVLPAAGFMGLLALVPPVGLIDGAAFLAGAGVEIFGVLWDVTMQRQIPADRLARVASYDMLGSYVCIPLGQVAVGPVLGAVGRATAVTACAATVLAATLAVLWVRDVRTLPGEARTSS